MTVDIYIREKSGTREIRIPLLPEELPFPSGDAVGISYEIMGLGEVVIPAGTELDGYAWKSAFPGEYRKNDPMIRGSWIHPKTYDSILNDWKQKGTELNLLVTGYPINADVYLKKYNGTAAGAFGDISYEIEFIEARNIVVTTTKVQQATTTRPATTSTTYTIKKGDTLWSIAKKFYGSGSKWKTIYDANKDIIEKTAKSRGMKSSDNGHWIFPGVTLTIPGVSGSSSAKSTTSSTQKATTPNKPTTAAEGATKANNEAYTSKRNKAIAEKVSTLNSKLKTNVAHIRS